MKKLIWLIFIVLLCSCAPLRPPRVTWYVDPWKATWQQYLVDKERCHRLAEAAFPIDRNRIRMKPYLAYQYQFRLAYYLNCMEQNGHRVYCETDEIGYAK